MAADLRFTAGPIEYNVAWILLTFLRSSPRGQTRHVYTPQADGGYALTLESSFDGGVQWEPVMSGRYRRA